MIQSFSRFLSESLEGLLDPGLPDVNHYFAPEAVFVFPFAPPDLPASLHGAEAITAHLARLPEMLEIRRFGEPVVHRTEDPAVRILEYTVEGKAVGTGRPYNQRYINVITVRNGRITRYVDYWNPLIVQEALQP